ncbi:MAG: FAD-dependent oxidoreductase [Myxococcota bacterium]
MSQTRQLRLHPDAMVDEAAFAVALAKAEGCAASELPPYQIVRKAIDARGRKVRFELVVELGEREPQELGLPHPVTLDGPLEVIVVGDGPAGLFCAYELARRGVRCVVIERGKRVQPRRRDLASLTRRGFVPTESNYCFGEGGAGTYSDGKLYTRANKRGNVRDVLEVLALHGAPTQILADARPHIGSNLLPKVVTAMRERLEACGVQFCFGEKVTELLVEGGQVVGVRSECDDQVHERLARRVVLATGHSGRDVWRFLQTAGARMVPKPFALGVRIEHPQGLVNRMQYGRFAGHAALPAAYYSLKTQVSHGAVFSFCMCPGGWIVPAATEADGLVVNGMSLTKRASPFANSGFVTTVAPEQWEAAGHGGLFGGVSLQRAIEQSAFEAGGGTLRAPATRVMDFLSGKSSQDAPVTSYRPGLFATDIAPVLDAGGLTIAAALRDGLRSLGRRMPRYLTNDAVLVATESRTSAPLRIERDSESLESPTLAGLYPAGEGAGFAGGIVSAALDGIRIAGVIASRQSSAALPA